jgi:short subunit dehydrogenase-like uncharacterized protein
VSATGGEIAVYGASGYTGRLIAAELAGAGVPYVLAGRNRAKLEIVAEDAGGDARVQAVELDDPAGLRALLDPCAAVIACAGPFTRLGEPVLEAAVETGTHYLDTTGEQPFMRCVFDEFGPRAERSGAALVTAMGFDYVPGDMIASLTADGMGELDDLALAYAVAGFGPSRGTARSALAMIGGGDVEWRAGDAVDADRSISRGTFDFPEPIGRQRMVRYPAGEHVTVPRHVRTHNVRTMLTASTTMPPGLGIVAPLFMPGFQLALRTPARRLLDAAIGRLPEGPKPESRRAARFTIVCEATQGARQRRGVISGADVYGMTARSVVAGALRCTADDFALSGALAPSQAFAPREFLPELSAFGVDWDVTEL